MDGGVDPLQFRHPQYAKYEIGRPLNYLDGMKVAMSTFCEPDAEPLRALVRDLGGRVVKTFSAADLILLGDDESRLQAEMRLSRSISATDAEKERFTELRQAGKVLQVRRFFDHIEAGNWIDDSGVAATKIAKNIPSSSKVIDSRPQSTPRRSSRLDFTESSPCW